MHKHKKIIFGVVCFVLLSAILGCKETYTPTSKTELQQIVDELIETNGNEANLNNIDTSNIVDMSDLFSSKPLFNGDISKWDVSNVKNMSWIFWQAESFNGDISKWDVSNVENATGMFGYATSFSGDISKWDLHNLKNAEMMFRNATSFNTDISQWNLTSLLTANRMFLGASSFNADVSAWNVGSVQNMEQMFENARLFDRDISKWNVSNVTTMREMFHNAKSFNADISNWDISNVKNMQRMFFGASSFNQDLSSWNTKEAINLIHMFEETPISDNLPTWYTKWETQAQKRAEAKAYLAQQAYAKGDKLRARYLYIAAIQIYSDGKYFYELANVEYETQYYRESAFDFQTAIGYLYPHKDIAYYKAAKAQLLAKEYEYTELSEEDKQAGLMLLEKALQNGYDNWQQLSQDEDFSVIREEEAYKKLLKKYQ